ncbi:MAG: zinc ribbon domain-containing protein [Deltaproteobacteria bacterium]|nr:MAG: zinc ribbon domain-containing protein [Deltaproteobacteria bacterium]
MPIYEYLCKDCGRVSAHLVLKPEGFTPACKHCGGRNLKRIISRVAFLRSEESRLERLTDPSRWGDIEGDPRAFRRWMKEVGTELGEDMGSDEIDQMVEEALKEESPKEEATE